MKLSTPFIVWALAATVCLANDTTTDGTTKSLRSRKRVGRHLTFSYLVNHLEPKSRAEIGADDEPIVGEVFRESSKGKRGGGNGKRNGNGNGRNNGKGNGNGNGNKNRNNRNGNGNNSNNRNNGGKGNGKGSKGQGGTGGKNDSKNDNKSIGTCRQICHESNSPREPVCDATSVMQWNEIASDNCCCDKGVSYLKVQFSTFYFEDQGLGGTFTIDTSSAATNNPTTVNESYDSPVDASREFNPEITAATDIATTTATTTTTDSATGDSTITAVSYMKARHRQKEKKRQDEIEKANNQNEVIKRQWEIEHDGDNGASTENIRIVDCSDECLRDPLAGVACSSVSVIQDSVVDGSLICFLQVDLATNQPLFDAELPSSLKIVFESDAQEKFVAEIHTDCHEPLVFPWASMALPEGMATIPYPINIDQEQAGLNFPVFIYQGGISTGFYEAARNDPTNEAGYQLDLAQCGCDCSQTFPPTWPPTTIDQDKAGTDTFSPTSDWSCPPSSLPARDDPNMPSAGNPRQLTPSPTVAPTSAESNARTNAQVEPTGTVPDPDVSTMPPTILFEVPSPTLPLAPTAPPSKLPTSLPTASPTQLPTQLPTKAPTFLPTTAPSNPPTSAPIRVPQPTTPASSKEDASPTSLPTCTDSPDGHMGGHMPSDQIGEGQEANTCSLDGAKSICKFRRVFCFSCWFSFRRERLCSWQEYVLSWCVAQNCFLRFQLLSPFFVPKTDDYICTISNFSNFCAMVNRAELQELFDGIDGITQYITLFAPTNRGCKLRGLGINDINSMDKNLLKHIVMTHATAGSIRAEQLQCGTQYPTLEGTFSVHATKCFVDTHAKAQYGFFNDEDEYPMILAPNNLELCNGLIQPVNHMIRVINF